MIRKEENGNKMVMFNSITELVDFVKAIRTEANTNGIRATFSYRCIGMVTKLERTGLELKDILLIAVFKGMATDTINCFATASCDSDNRYRRILIQEVRAV